MKYLSLILILNFISYSHAQNKILDKYESVINYLEDDYIVLNNNTTELESLDLSNLWLNIPNKITYGFIGSSYKKMEINFNQLIKNPYSKTEYIVTGNSIVIGNSCQFIGVLKIDYSCYVKCTEMPNGNHGILVGTYILKEKATNKYSGEFEGMFSTYWYKDDNGKIRYDDTWFVSAGFNNNQFSGTWREYGKTIKKQANWGDGRIPNSGDLDVGASEFSPSKKYINNGWGN